MRSKGRSSRSRDTRGTTARAMGMAPSTATVSRGLIRMVSGDETHRRTNEKPTRLTLTADGQTATSGTKDGANGSETHR